MKQIQKAVFASICAVLIAGCGSNALLSETPSTTSKTLSATPKVTDKAEIREYVDDVFSKLSGSDIEAFGQSLAETPPALGDEKCRDIEGSVDIELQRGGHVDVVFGEDGKLSGDITLSGPVGHLKFGENNDLYRLSEVRDQWEPVLHVDMCARPPLTLLPDGEQQICDYVATRIPLDLIKERSVKIEELKPLIEDKPGPFDHTLGWWFDRCMFDDDSFDDLS